MEVNENELLYQCKDLQGTLVDLVASVGDNTNNHFLPALWTPSFGTVPAAEVGNVLDNSAGR